MVKGGYIRRTPAFFFQTFRLRWPIYKPINFFRLDSGKQKMEDGNLKTDRAQATEPVALDSTTLARLIEEVRNEPADVARSYDRAHNRHNR
jgi:hypothetical protein